jgi:transposase
MDDERAVLARLDRIEQLERSGAAAEELLDEVRGLLREAEAWVGQERPAESGKEVVARLAEEPGIPQGASRTLVA